MGEFVCRKPSVKTHPSPQPQSKSVGQAMHYTALLQNIVTQDVFTTLVNHIILVTQPKLKTKTTFHYDKLGSILM